MKKYFVKYLPVEGEINPNDWMIDSYGNIFKCKSKEGNKILGTAYLTYVEGEPRKVKLFLCSRDIQVGDKVLDEEFCDWIVEENDLKNLSLLTKVIGEISKDAIWVKEGDEFNEDEIEEWYWHLKQNCFAISVKFAEEISNKPPNFCVNTWEDNKEYFKKGIFKIKCHNCQTYH